MKISIAMATYNGARYLPEQLQSFIEQTRQPDELVITDDNSTDNTPAIVEKFARTAPFEVRFSRNDRNLGYAGNFNTALLQTTGELVFLSDQDDVWFQDKLARVEKIADEKPDKFLFINDAALTDSQLHEIGLTKLGQIRSAGLPISSFVMGCCVAMRREYMELVLPIHRDYPAHDGWIVRIAEGIEKKELIDETLQYYRRHSSNESQAIANRIKRVTRLDVIKKQLIQVFNTNNTKTPKTANTIAKESLILAGVGDAIKRANDNSVKEKLVNYASRLKTKLEIQECRYAIRKHSRLARIPLVTRLWLKGDYTYFGGLKSVLRDIIF